MDLACGRGLTASLASLRWPLARVGAVDLQPLSLMPHWEASPCPVLYSQANMLKPRWADGVPYLRKQGGEVALLAMHACGELALAAVEAFDSCEGARLLVLAPCCLPLRGCPRAPSQLYASSEGGEQYKAWGDHLAALLRVRGHHVCISREERMLSVKNLMIVATKSHQHHHHHNLKHQEQNVVLKLSLVEDGAVRHQLKCEIQLASCDPASSQ